ncbi:MAG: hypothetical protein ACXWLH_01010 [Candidatus Saccharimonadales bacterium]
MQIISEVKTYSPFGGWQSDKSWDELFELANAVGDIISIHTDPRWHGSFDLIRRARSLTSKPILAKGIHARNYLIDAALEAGADKVLVVGRLPGVYLEHCLLEPSSLAELENFPKNSQVVWNSRDLKTGGNKQETFEQARQLWPGWLCQASNVVTMADVNSNADAVLVGTHLSDFALSIQQQKV